MTQPDDNFDLDAFNAAFAKEFGEPLAEDPESEAPEPAEPKQLVALVLTPVADEKMLARLMGLVKLDWPVFPSETGAVAAKVVDLDEMVELRGQPPEEAVKVALALSQTSEYGVVLLTSLVQAGDEGPSGQMRAYRYVGGKEAETLSPGIVLAGADSTVEKVVLGNLEPGNTPGVLSPLDVAQDEPPATEERPTKRRWGRRSR